MTAVRILSRVRDGLERHRRFRSLPVKWRYNIAYKVAESVHDGHEAGLSDDDVVRNAKGSLVGFLPPWAIWLISSIITELVKKLLAELRTQDSQ